DKGKDDNDKNKKDNNSDDDDTDPKLDPQSAEAQAKASITAQYCYSDEYLKTLERLTLEMEKEKNTQVEGSSAVPVASGVAAAASPSVDGKTSTNVSLPGSEPSWSAPLYHPPTTPTTTAFPAASPVTLSTDRKAPPIVAKRRVAKESTKPKASPPYTMTPEDISQMSLHTSEVASSMVVDHPKTFTFVLRGDEKTFVLHQKLLLVQQSDGKHVECQPAFDYKAFKTSDRNTGNIDAMKFRKALLKYMGGMVVDTANKIIKERKSSHCVLMVRGQPTDEKTNQSWTVTATLWFYNCPGNITEKIHDTYQSVQLQYKDGFTAQLRQMELDHSTVVPKLIPKLEKKLKEAESHSKQLIRNKANEKEKGAAVEKVNDLIKRIGEAKYFMENGSKDIKQRKFQLSSRAIQLTFRKAVWDMILKNHSEDFSFVMQWDRYSQEPDMFIDLHFPLKVYPQRLCFKKRYDGKTSNAELVEEMVHDSNEFCATAVHTRKEKNYSFCMVMYAISFFSDDFQYQMEMDVVMGHMGPLRGSSSTSVVTPLPTSDQKKN